MIDQLWRTSIEASLSDMDAAATEFVSVDHPVAISTVYQQIEEGFRIYTQSITPGIRLGITNFDHAPILAIVPDAYRAAELLDSATDALDDYLERCQ